MTDRKPNEEDAHAAYLVAEMVLVTRQSPYGGGTMSKFTKIPIEIEATRITEKIEIKTREGTLYGFPGEWLLTGIEGEKYPCGDAIFRKTYYPSGKDKCKYCKHNGKYPRYCDSYEVCTFDWEPELIDITIGNSGGNR